VRIIAATNRNLEAAVREKQFRADLYYRLSVVNIQTPSLRETPEDIPILANHFLQKHCATMSVEPKQLSAAALDRLSAYHWPGNARQLENEIKRLVASVRGKIITEDQVAIQSEIKPVAQSTHATPITGKSLFEAVDALERRMIQDALNQVGGNKLKAAQMLGMSRGGFLKKLKKLTLAAEV
jgi:two-component system response regulator AtoC